MLGRGTFDGTSLSAVRRLLFSQSEEFMATHLLLRALFGAASGAVLFLGVASTLPVTFDLKLAAGCFFVCVCAVGGALSSSFRCAVLLTFPSMLGSRGRAYLTLLVLSVLSSGPVWNIQRNVQAAAESLSCNLDLQLHHGRTLWRDAVRPFLLISRELSEGRDDFLSEARGVGGGFQAIRDEVVLQYGYDRFSRHAAATEGNDTQQQFTTKTLRQCDSVVEQGVARCTDWFRLKWAECMEAIPVPVLNHILCVSMKFHFLCDVLRVMTPWCRQQLPVEGNFGQLFDRLNASVDLLSQEFTTEVLVQEQQQQAVLGGAELDRVFTDSVRASFDGVAAALQQLVDVLQLLRSFTFITVFTQALGYLRRYRTDVAFDNAYVTSSFRRIDGHRRAAGRRSLLPLTASERRSFVEPWRPRIVPRELRQVTSGVLQALSMALLAAVLLAVDFSVFHVLDIVGRHSVTKVEVSGGHQVEVRVGGASMMARLLRRTVEALNSSSSLHLDADNRLCAPRPSPLPAGVYISCVCGVLLAAICSVLQVYANRLRHAIAASYHPDRERSRVMFTYNLLIHRRNANRKRVTDASRTPIQVLQEWTKQHCPRFR